MPAAPGDQQVPRPQEVFISYSRKDEEFVRRLDDALKSRGREAWVDWEDILPTEEFMQAIYAAIEGADTFIFVLTPDSIASVPCSNEIAHAAANNKRMVPIVARDVKADTVPEALAKLEWIFYCRAGDDFEKATDELISALDTDLNWVHEQTRLLTSAIEWNANGKNKSFVLHGDALRSAEQWLEQAGSNKQRQPTALQTEYIIASRKDETQSAVAAAKKIGEVASRGSVSLARYSEEGGKNVQALAHLAQALWLNPENPEASDLTAAMLTQLSWHVPLTGSMRHEDEVNSAQFSPDGERVVTASEDKTARLWDAASGKPIGQPMKHQGAVNSAQFSPDGERVVTASADKTARLWDAVSGKPVGEPMKHEGAVNSAEFSRDGQRLVTASFDSTARVWDAVSGKPIAEPMKHEGMVISAQFSPDGERVVTASEDRTARVWDAVSGKPIAEPMKHEGMVISAQFSPDGERVVTASADKTARLWDAATGKEIGEPMKHQAEAEVTSARFSPDGQRVVTASWDRTARLWDAASGKSIGELMKHEGAVMSAQFSRDGQRVVTASADNTARLWDAVSGKPVGEPMKHEGTVFSAQFSPDGQRLVTASEDKTARLWDAVTVMDKDTREDILLLAELAEATGSVTLETVGQAENLKLLTPEKVTASREKIAAKLLEPSSKLTPLQRVMKWSVSDRKSRTISPFSQVTVSKWLENRIMEGTVESLRAAMQVDPANVRLTAHLGRRLADQALEQTIDPDEARRARGEADFLTSRAQKLAPDNEEVKKLRDEVVKLLELKTK